MVHVQVGAYSTFYSVKVAVIPLFQIYRFPARKILTKKLLFGYRVWTTKDVGATSNVQSASIL